MKPQVHRCLPVLAMLCIALLTVQCKSSKKAATASATATDPSTPPAKSIRIDKSVDLSTVKTTPTKVDSAWIDGDQLHLKLIYGGGCREHRFELLGNGFMMKSLPAQTNIKLLHDSNDDHCRELIRETQVFDLKPLRSIGAKSPLVIHLERYETALKYGW